MDKKINLLKIFPLVLVPVFLLSSCTDYFNGHHYYNDNIDASYGLISTNNSGQTYVINLDNGSVVTPSTSLSGYTPKDSDRVWVRFYPVSETRLTDTTFNYASRIYNINDILFKAVKKLSQVSEDSVGHDPIILKDAWIAPKDILNLDLKFYSAGSVHYINLLDNGEGDGVTNPYILELRHNARGDATNFPVYAVVSFKLNSLRVQGQSQVKFFIRYTDYQGDRIDIPKTYNY